MPPCAQYILLSTTAAMGRLPQSRGGNNTCQRTLRVPIQKETTGVGTSLPGNKRRQQGGTWLYVCGLWCMPCVQRQGNGAPNGRENKPRAPYHSHARAARCGIALHAPVKHAVDHFPQLGSHHVTIHGPGLVQEPTHAVDITHLSGPNHGPKGTHTWQSRAHEDTEASHTHTARTATTQPWANNARHKAGSASRREGNTSGERGVGRGPRQAHLMVSTQEHHLVWGHDFEGKQVRHGLQGVPTSIYIVT
jgi:hypothetical protein